MKEDKDFEQFIRQELDDLRLAPDDALWKRIAEKQAPRNRFLRWRKRGFAGLSALALLAVTAYFFENADVPSANAPAAQVERHQAAPEKTLAPTSEKPEMAAATPTAAPPNEAAPNTTLDKSAPTFAVPKVGEADWSRSSVRTAQMPAPRPQPLPGAATSARFSPETAAAPSLIFDVKNGTGTQPTLSQNIENESLKNNSPEATAQANGFLPENNIAEATAPSPPQTEASTQPPLSEKHFDMLPFLQNRTLQFAANDKSLPPMPVILPVKTRRSSALQIGLVWHEGQLLAPDSENGHTRNLGLSVESKLGKNWRLSTGLELANGSYQVFYAGFATADAQASVRERFPVLIPMISDQTLYIVSRWQGIAFPVGASYSREIGLLGLDWFGRATLRPQLMTNMENVLQGHPFPTTVGIQRSTQPLFRLGWAGLQTGLRCPVFGRFQLEAGVYAERTLGRLNFENAVYRAMGLRVGLFYQ